MLNWLTDLVFRYNRQGVYDKLISDFYGFIPDSLKEPSVEFLASGKDKLERFFTIQAYNMQRRAIMDTKNAPTYNGILVHIRSLLLLIHSSKTKEYAPAIEEKIIDPLKGVDDFLKKGKALVAKSGK